MTTKGEVRARNFLLKKDWDHKICIGSLHAAYQAGEMSLFQLCGEMLKKVRLVRDKYADSSDEWWELDEIAGYFEYTDEGVFDECQVTKEMGLKPRPSRTAFLDSEYTA